MKKSIMFGVIGLFLGVVIAGFMAGQAVNNNNIGMMRIMGIDITKSKKNTATDHTTMSMVDMSKQLDKLSGDEFDKAFIEMMIAHHEGAIDMAKLSTERAKHDQIKQLSKDIISAQQKEIDDMQQWQKDWGYTADEMMNMMHSNN